MNNSVSFNFGRDLLGPVFYSFCFKLWSVQQNYSDNDAITLFMSRGGLRLKYFYEIFLSTQGYIAPTPVESLFTSRIAAFKSSLADMNEFAINEIAAEYRHTTIDEAILRLCGHEVYLSWFEKLAPKQESDYLSKMMDNEALYKILTSKDASSLVLKGYFNHQKELFTNYFQKTSRNHKNVLLVDTGWGGSIVKALLPHANNTSQNLMALFFGKYSYQGKHSGDWYNDIMGLEVEGDEYHALKPNTSIFLNRHLIESVCEVDCQSVRGYIQGSTESEIEFEGCYFQPEHSIPNKDDPLVCGIESYFMSSQKKGVDEIHKEASAAWHHIKRVIFFPRAKHLAIMNTKRSIDFGRAGEVPVLLAKAKGISAKRYNLKHSLWLPAQLVIEFPNIYLVFQLAYLIKLQYGLVRRVLIRTLR